MQGIGCPHQAPNNPSFTRKQWQVIFLPLIDVTTFDLTAGCIRWRAAKGRAQHSQHLLINPHECVEEVTILSSNITLPLQKRWVDHPRPHCKATCLNSPHSSDIPGSKLLPQLSWVQLILCRNPQKGPFGLQRNPSLCREHQSSKGSCTGHLS